MRYYEDKPFSAVVMFLPDLHHRFPWQQGYDYIRAFIVARVLLGFALGVFAVIYFPRIATHLAWPSLIVGAVLFVAAAKGMLRRGT